MIFKQNNIKYNFDKKNSKKIKEKINTVHVCAVKRSRKNTVNSAFIAQL